MVENNPITYTDLVKPTDSITQAISQLYELNDTFNFTYKNIKAEALQVVQSLQKVSGATSDNRKVIQTAVKETDRLARAKAELAFAESENAKKLAILKQGQKEANEINKLVIKINQSAEGSYNKLSAQYSLNKIFLNNMSKAEREATEDGRQLVEETNAIYEEMKRLQAETGKTSLNVGNYAEASKSLIAVLRENTAELARMKIAGEENTEAYRNLLEATAQLKDDIGDARNEIANMASDTSNLDAVLDGLGAAAGGFSAITGGAELFGAASEDVEKAQTTLQASIAVTTGLQEIQNAVQTDSALMLGVARLQTYALAKSQALQRLITIQGTSATVGATIAQRAFNLVATANPYVLLATALITVVGAMVLFSKGTESAAEKQSELNELQKAYLDLLDIEAGRMQEIGEDRVKSIENELEVAKARGLSTKQIQAIEDNLMKARIANNARLKGFYGDEYAQLGKNRELLTNYQRDLIKLQEKKAAGKDVDEEIASAQGLVDVYTRLVKIGSDIKQEGEDIAQEQAVKAAERTKAAIEQAKEVRALEIDLIRKNEDSKNALIANSFDRERAEVAAQYDRQIVDLKIKLKTEKNLTEKGRQAINNTIANLQTKQGIELKAIDTKEQASRFAEIRANQDLELSLMEDGVIKRLKESEYEFDRRKEDIKIRLATEKGLTIQQQNELTNELLIIEQQRAIARKKINDEYALSQLQTEAEQIQLRLDATKKGSQDEIDLRAMLINKQRQIELKENALKTEEVRQNEADINKKYDKLVLDETSELSKNRALLLFDQQQALDQSEFDLLKKSEAAKTKFRLQAERARLKKILEINEAAGKVMSDAEVKTLENLIKKLDQTIGETTENYKNIWEVIGLDLPDEQMQAINTTVNFAVDNLGKILDANVQLADIAVQNSQRQVEAAQERVNKEIEARNNGYASNVIAAQKELDLAKKTQEQAVKDKQKAVKQQQLLDTITQASSLITASANIWSSLSGIPVIGPILAVAAIGTMFGTFIAAKIKANQLAKAQTESYGEGIVELLQGGSHQSGNDIDLGTKKDGTKRRAEGGEYFAVINKRNSRRFRKHIPDVINSLNRGTFADKYLKAYNSDGLNITVTENNPSLNELKEDVREIRNQNSRKIIPLPGGGMIETYKNLRRYKR